MNRGTWWKLARTAREWTRRFTLSAESGVERLRECPVPSWELRGFREVGQKANRNAGFKDVVGLGWWQEDWKRVAKNVEKWPNGLDSALVENPICSVYSEHVSNFRWRRLDWIRDVQNQNVENWFEGRMPGSEPFSAVTPLERSIEPKTVKSESLSMYICQPAIFSSMKPGLVGFFNVNSTRDNRDVQAYKIVPQNRARGYAKAAAVSPQMQKPVKLRLYMGSPGVIGEPYKKLPPLTFLRRWFTKEGWSRRKQSFMSMIRTSYTIAKLRQKTKGYSQQRFYQEASDLYKQINVALAEGERTQLRQLVTDSVFSIMKNELKHRESMWTKVKWELVGPITKIRTLQGRLIGVDKNNHDNAFVQMTLRILSKQKFAAYDKRGKLVAGDPDKELLVEDYWVFEKPLLLTEAKWRLCGRLSV